MRETGPALLCCLLVTGVGCGAARPATRDAPVPSTAHDPASFAPPPSPVARTGAPAGLRASGGDEQARQLLVRLVLAMRDGDETMLAQLLSSRVGHAAGAARAAWPRATVAHQLALASPVSPVDPDAPFESLVDPATIRVLPASAHFPGALPAGVEATDLAVLFTATPGGRRSLGGLTSGVLVVRPGPEPRVVAR